MRKKLMSVLVALAVALTMAPALPEMAHADEPAISLTQETMSEYLFDSTLYSLDTGDYRLDGDVSLDKPIYVSNAGLGHNVTLDLNGHTLTWNGSEAGQMLRVNQNCSLDLVNNIDAEGTIDGNKKDVTGVTVCGTFTMGPNVVIANCRGAAQEELRGGGVTVLYGGSFTMSDGSIRGCSSQNGGGGVEVGDQGSFTMNEGTIDECESNLGGAVHVAPDSTSFTMNGGTITDSCTGAEGAVFLSNNSSGEAGTMIANGGEVYGKLNLASGATVRTDSEGNGTVFYGDVDNGGGIEGGVFYGGTITGNGTIDEGRIWVKVTAEFYTPGSASAGPTKSEYRLPYGHTLSQEDSPLPDARGIIPPPGLDAKKCLMDGWAVKDDSTKTFDESTPVTQNVTIEPHFVLCTTVAIPYTIVVKRGGNVAPGKKTFQLELTGQYGHDQAPDLGDLQGAVLDASVETDGAGSYPAEATLRVPNSALKSPGSTWLYIRQVQANNAGGWTCSDAVYAVRVTVQEEMVSNVAVFKTEYVDKTYGPVEGSEVNITPGDDGAWSDDEQRAMTFENVYTANTTPGSDNPSGPSGPSSPSGPNNPDGAGGNGGVPSGSGDNGGQADRGGAGAAGLDKGSSDEKAPAAKDTGRKSPGKKPAGKKKAAGTDTPGLLLAKVVSRGAHAQKLTWTKLADADGYTIWYSRCSSDGVVRDYQKVKSVKASATRAYVRTGLARGGEYKYYVSAWKMAKGKKRAIAKSPKVHAIAGDVFGAFSNVKSVKTARKTLALKKGASKKLGTVRLVTVRAGKTPFWEEHTQKVRYVSSNKKVAAVTAAGEVRAKRAGKADVYVLAANGTRTKVTVTVR